MGVVYKAFDTKLKRTVALKVLIAGEDASEEAIKRFHREAEAVAKLGHHPNIVPVHGIGQEGNLHYFAMHFVEGKPLDRMIDDGQVTPNLAASFTKRLAEALAHAHSHGILHRDVKPPNILIDKAGEPQITDFGLAKDVDSRSKLTYSGTTLGTPHYMPPEQADGRLRDIDERSDVYSLGATLYEMLTFEPPFTGDTLVAVIQKVLLTEPVQPRRKNPIVEKDLETICLKCLEKERGRRYSTAKALALDLGKLLAGDPISARPASLRYRAMKKVKRNKALVVISALSLLALLSVGVFSAKKIARSSRDVEEEKSRATNELSKRKIAESEKRSALGDLNEAKSAIRKGRAVAKILRMAELDLGKIRTELENCLNSKLEDHEKRAFADRYWEKIHQFGETLPRDDASRSAWLAVQGWFKWLSGYERDAFEFLNRSREADPEVTYSYLFAAMIHLSKYLANQDMPSWTVIGDQYIFNDIPDETGDMAPIRKNLEAKLKAAEKAPVWGETAKSEFLKLFRGIRRQKGSGDKRGQFFYFSVFSIRFFILRYVPPSSLPTLQRNKQLRYDPDHQAEITCEAQWAVLYRARSG